MKIMTADEVKQSIAALGEDTPFWARANDRQKWTLLNRVTVRGIEYGMRNWEFCGPVLNPDQVIGRGQPVAWVIRREQGVWSVRRFEPVPANEAADAEFIPLYP